MVSTKTPEATELADDLEKMGPTYVKLGKLLLTRADLLPLPYIKALARLQDKVEPFPFEEVEKIVSFELGISYQRLFSNSTKRLLCRIIRPFTALLCVTAEKSRLKFNVPTFKNR